MKTKIIIGLTLLASLVKSQNPENFSPLDARHWGVVLDHPSTKNVIIKTDVPYLTTDKGTLKIDIYSPPGLKPNALKPAVIFLNGIGEAPDQPKVKSWGIYKSWPQLMAAYGFIGISMETDGDHVQDSFKGLFKYLNDKGQTHNIDANKLGVYAASANVTQSADYLMNNDAYKGIRAVVLYYGRALQGPFRKDLPVYYVIAEGDLGRTNYSGIWTEVLKNNAPWTIKMASGMPHAFDAFEDTDESRIIVKETISFWRDHLEVVQKPSWSKSLGRSILSAQYGHNDEELVALLPKWLADHPEDGQAIFQYASALKNLRRYDESEKEYRAFLKYEPKNQQALTYLYLLMHIMNRPNEADPFLIEAEKVGPINRFTYQGMAMTMYSINRHDVGVKFFQKVIEEDPSGVNYYNLACGYSRMGDKDKAIAAIQKAIDAGFAFKQQFDTDTDMDNLRDDPRFKVMMEKLANPAGQDQGSKSKPHIRAHHALIYDEGSKAVLLTAGSTPLNGGQSYKMFNDVWKFDGTKWMLSGNAGDERSGIQMAFDSKRKKIFSFGGFFSNGSTSGQLRVLENGDWKIVADVPEMKATEAGLVYDIKRDRLVAFGGSADRGKMSNVTWEWDGKTWNKFTGTSPAGRQAFAMIYDSKRNKTILYGGGTEIQNSPFLDDTWEFDGKVWTKVSEKGPGSRVSPGFTYDSKRGLFIIFGGVSKDGMLSDTWSWNGKVWSKLSDKGPTPRAMGQLAYDKDRDKVILFGGRIGWPNDVNDTWEWDGVSWKEIKIN